MDVTTATPLPLFPGIPFPIANNSLRGTGQVSWLSSKAGLIACQKPIQATISFQLKDFCDQQVTDLTSVLRPGFKLAFIATASDTNDWIATSVVPIGENDATPEEKEINMELFEKSFTVNARQSSKDPYSVKTETESLFFLLQVFQQNRSAHIPLSTLHSKISNSGNEELYRYVGSSSLKRRQFVERRSYIFHITDGDMVFLQPPEVYTSVCVLSSFLLHRGGVTSSDSLFAFFNSSAAIPAVVKDSVQNNRQRFMEFLSRHKFAFAPFPSQFYVAVCRTLPFFDYASFMKKNFPNGLVRSQSISGSFSNTPTPLNAFGSFDREPMGVSSFGSNHSIYPSVFDDLPMTPSATTRVPPPSPWATDIGTGFGDGFGTMNSRIVSAQPIMGNGNANFGSLTGGGFDMLRRQPSGYMGGSPPLPNVPVTRKSVDAETQTDYGAEAFRAAMNIGSNVVDRAAGPESRCVCRCTCNKQQMFGGNGNELLSIQPKQTAAIGDEQKARRESPPHSALFGGFQPFFATASSASSFSSPEGSLNGTPDTDPFRSHTGQTPQTEQRLFDPFSQVYPFELKLASLRL